MNNKCKSNLRRFLNDQQGQVLPWVTSMMLALLGMAGLTVDVGRAYVTERELQFSSNAAALAGAAQLPSNSATSVANTYSSDNGLGAITVTSTPTPECLTTLVARGLACGAPANANALQVKQTAVMPTLFMTVFGIRTVNLQAIATASEYGGTGQKYNVAVVLDTTASMSDADSGLQCTGSQEKCALQGVTQLYGIMDPCALNTTCVASGTPHQVTGAVDSISLFVFPAVTTATQSKDSTCPSSNPTIIPYTFTNVTTGNYLLPATATYQIVPFESDYRASDTATTLNATAPLVIAAGGGTCSGVQSPGGEGTYYAQAIIAAQAALVAQAGTDTDVKSAMIIISDGDATAASSSGQITATTGTLNGTGSNHTVTYPSALGECGQAVWAAASAASAGTKVFTIGYGAEMSGCTTDATYSMTVAGGGGNWTPGDSPCQAIAAMASDAAYFFSDKGQGCSSTENVNLTSLKQIFQAIAGSLTLPALIPNSTT